MEDGAATPEELPSPPPIGRLVFFAVVVVLCAAIASGSCILIGSGQEIGEGRKSVVGALLSALLSPGLALVISFPFLLLIRRWSEAKLFVIISVSAYIAGMIGAWWLLLLVPAVLAVGVAIAGGRIAGRITQGDNAGPSGKVTLISAIAIAVAAVGFIVGFWLNYDLSLCFSFGCDGGISTMNLVPFAIAAGIMPPLCAVAGALIATEFSRS